MSDAIGTKQFRALVHGKVQGVCYRATTVEEARALGLAGYARNLPDGSVEVVARGEEPALRRLIEYLHVGPSLAQVISVDVDWSDRSATPEPFSVRR
jgi:acylphosphatase